MGSAIICLLQSVNHLMTGGDNVNNEQIKEIIIACIENNKIIKFATSQQNLDVNKRNEFNAQQIANFANTLKNNFKND